MKLEEKRKARELRKKGWSIREITKELGVAKGSVSVWVRDIELTKKQKQKLSKNRVSFEVVEQRRQTRLKNENARRQRIIDSAKDEIKKLSKNDLFLVGVSLYWGEGAKTRRSGVQFSNSDPEMIRIIVKFFREVCNVPTDKLIGRIHIHPHLDFKKAEGYWSNVSGIPLTQFYKTYRKPNKSSKNKKDTLPHGTFDIIICNTELFLKLQGWREKLCEVI
ncbi:MAG: hypothetical protein WDZ40_02750 [Candidatus Spechtbacterales bacterium]